MRFLLAGGVLAALALALLPAAAPAAQSAPTLRACGNTEAGGVLIGDITSRRVKCPNARRVARAVPSACGNEGTCTVRGFSCITAQALEELRFARCSKSGGGEELFKVIRFDFGS
jgi:hypothetical protein